jgi:hypothetical protein
MPKVFPSLCLLTIEPITGLAKVYPGGLQIPAGLSLYRLAERFRTNTPDRRNIIVLGKHSSELIGISGYQI